MTKTDFIAETAKELLPTLALERITTRTSKNAYGGEESTTTREKTITHGVVSDAVGAALALAKKLEELKVAPWQTL